MILGDLLDLIGQKKRKKERIETTQELAIGMGIVAAAGAALGITYTSKLGKKTRETNKNKGCGQSRNDK